MNAEPFEPWHATADGRVIGCAFGVDTFCFYDDVTGPGTEYHRAYAEADLASGSFVWVDSEGALHRPVGDHVSLPDCLRGI